MYEGRLILAQLIDFISERDPFENSYFQALRLPCSESRNHLL